MIVRGGLGEVSNISSPPSHNQTLLPNVGGSKGPALGGVEGQSPRVACFLTNTPPIEALGFRAWVVHMRGMTDRPKLFDDLAGVAGGAISALAGLREEAEALVRTRLDDAIRRLDLVKREEFDAAMQMAANAREAQEKAETAHAALLARLDALDARIAKLETPPAREGGGPGMMA